MAELQGATRQPKHMIFLDRLGKLANSVLELESLADRIDPMPPIQSAAEAPRPTTTLTNFLDHTPGDLTSLTERVDKAIERIKVAIF